MAKKVTQETIHRIDTSLAIIERYIDDCNEYIASNYWKTIKDEEKRNKEYKFQTDMINNLLKMNDSYMEQVGIMDKIRLYESRKKTTRSGVSNAGIQGFVNQNIINKE